MYSFWKLNRRNVLWKKSLPHDYLYNKSNYHSPANSDRKKEILGSLEGFKFINVLNNEIVFVSNL